MSETAHISEEFADYTEEDLALFSRRVAELRRAQGWKQRELSRRTGIHASRLSRIERGTVWPGLEELVVLRRALQVGLDELVLGPRAASATEGEEERLIRAIQEVAPPEDCGALRRLLHALLTGYRIAGRASNSREED
jgi:transcriptional regulator with XRE-family HTH domain